MEFLYTIVDYLPPRLQGSVVGLLLIVLGYFISKIIAALSFRAIKRFRSIAENSRVTRLLFWSSWLAFIILAYAQMPLIVGTKPLRPMSITYLVLIFITFSALLLLEAQIKSALTSVYDLIKILNFGGLNKLLRLFLIYFGWIFFVFLASLTPSSISKIGLKTLATVFITGLGFFLAKIVKETINSFVKQDSKPQPFIVKISFYIPVAIFFISASSLWWTSN